MSWDLATALQEKARCGPRLRPIAHSAGPTPQPRGGFSSGNTGKATSAVVPHSAKQIKRHLLLFFFRFDGLLVLGRSCTGITTVLRVINAKSGRTTCVASKDARSDEAGRQDAFDIAFTVCDHLTALQLVSLTFAGEMVPRTTVSAAIALPGLGGIVIRTETAIRIEALRPSNALARTAAASAERKLESLSDCAVGIWHSGSRSIILVREVNALGLELLVIRHELAVFFKHASEVE